ncbi:hypothetical protein BJ546DRAFT_802547, partial [Cryomyces antarcticus]
VQEPLKTRAEAAFRELGLIMVEDVKSYPINYDRYYTDTVRKHRQAREKKILAECVEGAAQHRHLRGCCSNHTSASVDVRQSLESYSQRIDPDMEKHSWKRALDYLFRIYKVSSARGPTHAFIANITTRVVERHIVRGLEKVSSPVSFGRLSESDAEGVQSCSTS